MQMFGRRTQEAVLCVLVIHVYTATTEQFVRQCPHTRADWERESMTLQCKDPNYYHCLRDNNGRFLQLCSTRVWIQKEMCPEFNSKAGRIDVFECPVDQIDCPQTIFWSNSAYLFPGCYQNSTTAVRTTTTTTTTLKPPTTTIKTAKKNDNSPNLSIVLPIVVSVVLIVIGAIVALYMCFKSRRKGGKNNKGDFEDAVLSDVVTHKGNKTKGRAGVCEEEQQRMIGLETGNISKTTTNARECDEEERLIAELPAKMKQNSLNANAKNHSKERHDVKFQSDITNGCQKRNDDYCVLILLSSKYMYMYIDDNTIKHKAQEYLNITINMTNDFKKWKNNKTEGAYVFKDWIASIDISNDDELDRLKREVRDAIKKYNTKFVFLVPLESWSNSSNLITMNDLPKCITHTISLTSGT